MASQLVNGVLNGDAKTEVSQSKKPRLTEKKVTVVLGTQWGDEGKGKIVDMLATSADVVCRCQGGNNAGHTVVTGDNKYAFHMLPSGIVNPNCMAVIGNGCVIHPQQLFDEIEQNKVGLDGWENRLLISNRAHIVFDLHQKVDGMQETGRGKDLIGTTKRGIGPAYSSKATRNGLRMADLMGDFEIFESRFRNLVEYYKKHYDGLEMDVEEELRVYKELKNKLKPFVVDTIPYMNKALSSGKNILIEGAQSNVLDIDFGSDKSRMLFSPAQKCENVNILTFMSTKNFMLSLLYMAFLQCVASAAVKEIVFIATEKYRQKGSTCLYPYVTSSNCSVGGVCTGLGIPPHVIGDVYGVVKAYLTRVGSGGFPTELFCEQGNLLCDRGHEYGVTTGRRRRVGWLDMVMLRYSQMINGFTAIAITKLDILDVFEEIKIGVAYWIGDRKVEDSFPATDEELKQVKVEYLTLPGWNTNTEEVRNFKELPENAQAYVYKIQELLGVPVKWVGVGQARASIIELF